VVELFTHRYSKIMQLARQRTDPIMTLENTGHGATGIDGEK